MNCSTMDGNSKDDRTMVGNREEGRMMNGKWIA